MTILINAISAKMGGIVTYTRNLAISLAERGVAFELAAPPTFPYAERVIRVRAGDYPPLRRLVWEQSVWRAMVMRRRPRILFSSANFALLGSPVPQVLLVREGGLFDPFYLANVAPEQGLRVAVHRNLRRQLMLLSARAADQVVTPTNTMRDLLLKWDPELEPKLRVNCYGTLTEAFSPAPIPRPWRGDGKLRLLYVSVYYPHKDPGTPVRAVQRLRDEGIDCKLTLTMTVEEIQGVVGGAQDAFVVAEAASAGLLELGRKSYDDLPSIYHQHDVFVFPSVSETFGHSLVEAMSSSIPLVVADTAINREVCGDSALYFKPFSSISLVDCLKRLDADPTLRETLVRRGRRRVLEKFGWSDHVTRQLDIFAEVSERSGKR